jgi:hypothetical protein
MATPLSLQLRTEDPINVFAEILPLYREHLLAARYNERRRRYLAAIVHFGQWLAREEHAAGDVDEAVIKRFLSEHLPRYTCQRPVPLRMIEVRAALNLLLRLLRAQGIAAMPSDDEIARELSGFNRRMANRPPE